MTIKALIIDDDPAMVELLGLVLQSHGLTVLSATNGEDGIQLVKTENPDITILDLMMPGKDGWDVCKQIRQLTQAPITILSALNDPGIISSALDAGADDYLVKPVPSSILIAHINKLTRRASMENNGAAFHAQSSLNFEQKAIQA